MIKEIVMVATMVLTIGTSAATALAQSISDRISSTERGIEGDNKTASEEFRRREAAIDSKLGKFYLNEPDPEKRLQKRYEAISKALCLLTADKVVRDQESFPEKAYCYLVGNCASNDKKAAKVRSYYDDCVREGQHHGMYHGQTPIVYPAHNPKIDQSLWSELWK